MGLEITFYQVDETIIKSLAPLLLKILDEKKKVLIFCNNDNQIKEIDNSLWSYGRNKFIPHVTIFDRDFQMQRQPILISNQEENSNKADYLVFLDQPSENFVNSFQRSFYFFEENNLKTAKKISQTIKPSNCYKKINSKWEKFEI